jgi:glycosyltransferase involved in cell wall biosynthesis
VAINRVVVINDASVARGGATGMATLSARLLAARGIPVTFLSGDSGQGAAFPPGVTLVPLGDRSILDQPVAAALLRGLYNANAARFVAAWIAQYDTPGTVYHLHGWAKILSPAVFAALRPVAERLVVSAHDFYLVCPTGGYFDFQREDACTLRPMGLRCITRNCDSQHFAHKLWRTARNAVRAALTDLSQGSGPILAVHDGMLPHLAHGGIAPARLRALRNPASPWTAQRVRAEANAVFYFVGRLSVDKGADLCARAAREAGVPLRFIGQGPLAASLEAEFPEFIQLGWQDRAGIAQHVQDARAILYPTRMQEPYGLVAVEALTSGIPVVLSEHAMLAPDVVAGGYGLACETADASALAGTLRRLAADDAAVGAMSRRAHARASCLTMTEDAWVGALASTYAALLPAAAPAHPLAPATEFVRCA